MAFIIHSLYLHGQNIFDYSDRADGISLWINCSTKLRPLLSVSDFGVAVFIRRQFDVAKVSRSSIAHSRPVPLRLIWLARALRDRVYISGEWLREPVVLDQHELLFPGDAEGGWYEVRWEQGARGLGRTCSRGKIYSRRGLFSNRLASLFMHPQILSGDVNNMSLRGDINYQTNANANGFRRDRKPFTRPRSASRNAVGNVAE